jgi:hypothetical protein
MMPIPPAAAAVMTAAADDYRLNTPPNEQTPAGLIARIGEYLLSSGYEIRPDLGEAA